MRPDLVALRAVPMPTSARLWPLPVDGLFVLLDSGRQASRRARVAALLSFLFGIGDIIGEGCGECSEEEIWDE